MTDPLFDVSDKIVIITGGLGQIGAEFVKEFYRRGSKVAVIARSVNPERIQKTLGTELAESERIAVYALDIQNKSEINTFLDTLEKKSMGFMMSAWDNKLIKYGKEFEDEMMDLSKNISLEDALDSGWKILADCFDKEETGIKTGLLDKYWPERD